MWLILNTFTFTKENKTATMSFSPKVLANIKHPTDSDEDNGAEHDDDESSLLAVLKSIPETTTTEIGPIVEMIPSSETFKQEAVDPSIDPLLNNSEAYTQNCFSSAYQDSDIIRSDESDEDNESDATSLPTKKMRLQMELKGNNGYTWSASRQVVSATYNSFNSALQSLQPKCKGPAQTINNILEMWSLLIDEQIISEIVHYTNIEIKKHKAKLSYNRSIDAAELRAWMGLNYLCGIFRNAMNNGPLDELWSLELGNAIFRATMSLKRFEFILVNLRFGDNANTSKKELHTVMNVWNKFLVNCRSYYAPSGNCCVDEVLLKFPYTKEAARLLVMCDVKTLYMCNSVFCHSGEYRERDVLRIVSDIKGSKRNISLPAQLTTVELAQKLFQMKLSVAGILPNGSKEIPTEFANNSTSINKLYSDTITVKLSHQNLGILMYSSVLDKKINVENLYSLSCRACQNYQKAASMYSTIHATQPKRNSWAMSIFQNILDYALVNAWILFAISTNGDGSMKQRDFQRHLGLYLTQQQLKRQLNSDRLTLPQKVQISEVLGESVDKLFADATKEATKNIKIDVIPQEKLKIPEGVQILTKNLKTRLRCRKCPGRISRKTKTRCQQCLRPLCQKHFVQRCRECTGLPDVDTEKDASVEADEADNPVMSDSEGEQEHIST